MSEMTRVIPDATCAFCGCVCDDIRLTVDLEAHKITKAENACVIGRAWFKEHGIEERPYALVDGRETSTEQGIEAAAQILAEARFPAIYGLSSITCEAQRETVAIADMIGGNVDSTASVCHGPSGMAFQSVGESVATLGEIRNRADLLVFWGCNPAEAHPRLFARYAVTAKGMYVPNGRKDRTVVLADVRRTQSAAVADIFIQVKPKRDFEVLWALRALVKGRRVDPSIEELTGVSLATLEDLANRMKSCRFGVLLFGMGLTMTRGRHFNTGALLALAADLNEFTHFVVKPLRGHGNVTGADAVMGWQTGYPFGINMSRGYPRFNPGEFTTVDMLVRREADAVMVVGADPGANFPQPAIEHLKRIPLIVIDPKATPTSKLARVVITTSCYGVSQHGTAYRMDHVPITLHPALPSPYPSDEEVLKRIRARVGELLGGNRLPFPVPNAA